VRLCCRQRSPEQASALSDRRCPGRVVSINWGPWEGGMVSPELGSSSLNMVWLLSHEPWGARVWTKSCVGDEKGGSKSCSGYRGWPTTNAAASSHAVGCEPGFSTISTGASLSRLADGSVEIVRTLDPAHDLYSERSSTRRKNLFSHGDGLRVDGRGRRCRLA
jgi:hypothetical protein